MVDFDLLLGIDKNQSIDLVEGEIFNKLDQRLNPRLGVNYVPTTLGQRNYSMASHPMGLYKTESIWKMESSSNSFVDPAVIPISPTFPKLVLPTPIHNIPYTTGVTSFESSESVAMPMPSYSIDALAISRVLVAMCNDITKLKYLVQLYIDPMTILGTRRIIAKRKEMLVIGWFDLRTIMNDINNLKRIACNEGLKDLEFKFVEDETTFMEVINTHNFRYLEDCYDTVYVTAGNKFISNLCQFQKELYFQLSKNGSIHSMDQIGSNGVCFKVRFYDIRIAFEIQRRKYTRAAGVKVKIYGTLVELFEDNVKWDAKMLADGTMSELRGVPQLSEAEWKKFMHMKHRRLASPFSIGKIPQENNIIIDKIARGEETRVTVMIRNIPNQVTHEQLKDFIDFTSWGCYEFLCM